jgi:hypothetical protein
MSLQNKIDLADKLEKISEDVVRSGAMPIITRNGILIGNYIVQPREGKFLVKNGTTVLYSTYSKSAAMIIARMMIRQMSNERINEIVDADRIAFSCRNDLEIFKHQVKVAEKRNDYLKQELFLNRFEVTDEKYQQAKGILQRSYSTLF